MADLRINVSADDKASPKIKDVERATEKLTDAQKKSAKQSELTASAIGLATTAWGLARDSARQFAGWMLEGVRAVADDERSIRQLALAIGTELTPRFVEYSEALEKSIGIDANKTRAMTAMLYRFGLAPEAIEGTIKTLIDYAEVSGGDALRATEELVSSVNSGRPAFRELGLEVGKASTKSEQAALVIDALGKKVGGASDVSKDTLEGRARLASVAFQEVQKTFGGFVAEIDKNAGVLDAATSAMNDFALGLSLIGEGIKEGSISAAVEKRVKSEQKAYLQKLYQDPALQAALEDLEKTVFGESQKPVATSPVNPNDGLTEEARREAERKSKEQASKRAQYLAKQRADFERNQKLIENALEEGADRELEIARRRDEELYEQEEKAAEARLAREAASYEKGHELFYKAMDKRRAAFEAEEQRAAQMGAAIGSAFANALASQINKLAAGEEMSMEEMFIDIIVGAGSVALAAFGGPIGMALTPVVGALGNLAKSEIRKGQTRHSGGWIDAPRFHSGAWVGSDERPAILQTGERVLSRQEVASMGGSRAVDGAARGGGGVTVNVSTLDGSTAREYFERAGGRALLNAVRTGRGAPTLLFGGG